MQNTGADDLVDDVRHMRKDASNAPSGLPADDNLLSPPDSGPLTAGALGAVVCPLTPAELPAALRNLGIWAEVMASEPPLSVRPRLVFSFNCESKEELREPLLRTFQEHAVLQQHFETVEIEFCGLPPEKDVYVRRPTGEPFPYGLKAGPNWLFYETTKRWRTRAQFIFLMETDCRPIRPDWLGQLEDVCRVNREAWVIGSHYRGISPLAWSVARHINGNALYNVGDPQFASFLDEVLWPWMHAYIARHDPSLAYDCAWELFLNNSEMEDPARYDWIVARNVLNRFRICDQIINIGGTIEQSGDYLWTEEDIRSQHVCAAVVHGPLAPTGSPRRALGMGKPRARGSVDVRDGVLSLAGDGSTASFARSIWLPRRPFEPGLGLRISLRLPRSPGTGLDVRAMDPNGRTIGHAELRRIDGSDEPALSEATVVPSFSTRHAFIRILLRPAEATDNVDLKVSDIEVAILQGTRVVATENLLDDCGELLRSGEETIQPSGRVDLGTGEPPLPAAGACISLGPCIDRDGTSISSVTGHKVQGGAERNNVPLSLTNVRTEDAFWPRIKFKFCINSRGRALEFRKGAGWPEMFERWPSSLRDEHGPVLRLADWKPLSEQLRRWKSARDRDAVRIIATHLAEILEVAAEESEDLRREVWQEQARMFSASLLDALQASSVHDADGSDAAAHSVRDE